MRTLKRWRALLIIFVCIGIAWFVTAYVRSPGYRAAQAFARIQEGMSRDQAYDIVIECGGYSIFRTGYDICDERYFFGDQCSVGFDLNRESQDGESARIIERILHRPTFAEWVVSLVDSVKQTPQTDQSDANERMQELLNQPESQKQIRAEWKRFWEIEQPKRLSGSKD